MNVVGLDLSLTASGVAESDGATFTVHTGPDAEIGARLAAIREHISHAVVHADLAVLEGPSFASKGSGVVQLGMVHGVVRQLLWSYSVPVAIATPQQVKKYATGSTSASKSDMRMALYKRTGLDIADDNQVDAWWLRAMGLEHAGTPVVELPQAQRDTLAKVEWP